MKCLNKVNMKIVMKPLKVCAAFIGRFTHGVANLASHSRSVRSHSELASAIEHSVPVAVQAKDTTYFLMSNEYE